MPFDSNGNAQITRSVAVSGQTVQAIQVNVPFDDVQSMLNQVLLRSGVAGLSGNLSASGFKFTNLAAGSADGDSVNMSQFNEVADNVTKSAPPGAVQAFRLKLAPAGWIVENGGTIGSALSNATTRANADTLALYTALWNNFTNAELPVQTSGGSSTTRGASAAADFASNKRLRIFDARTRFLRGSDSGLGYDTSIVVGLAQDDLIESHTHPVVDTGHTHVQQGSGTPGGTATAQYSGALTAAGPQGTNTAPAMTGITVGAVGGSETRPRASAVLYCIKL